MINNIPHLYNNEGQILEITAQIPLSNKVAKSRKLNPSFGCVFISNINAHDSIRLFLGICPNESKVYVHLINIFSSDIKNILQKHGLRYWFRDGTESEITILLDKKESYKCFNEIQMEKAVLFFAENEFKIKLLEKYLYEEIDKWWKLQNGILENEYLNNAGPIGLFAFLYQGHQSMEIIGKLGVISKWYKRCIYVLANNGVFKNINKKRNKNK